MHVLVSCLVRCTQSSSDSNSLLCSEPSDAPNCFLTRRHVLLLLQSLADIGLVMTVKALSEVMYREMKGTGGCYKLLNATGPVGSQGAQQQAAAAAAAAAQPARSVRLVTPPASIICTACLALLFCCGSNNCTAHLFAGHSTKSCQLRVLSRPVYDTGLADVNLSLKNSPNCFVLHCTSAAAGDPDYNLDIDAPLVHYSNLQQPLQRKHMQQWIL
jgi:hypothetical protein